MGSTSRFALKLGSGTAVFSLMSETRSTFLIPADALHCVLGEAEAVLASFSESRPSSIFPATASSLSWMADVLASYCFTR
jgi:hypothetical protein